MGMPMGPDLVAGGGRVPPVTPISDRRALDAGILNEFGRR